MEYQSIYNQIIEEYKQSEWYSQYKTQEFYNYYVEHMDDIVSRFPPGVFRIEIFSRLMDTLLHRKGNY